MLGGGAGDEGDELGLLVGGEPAEHHLEKEVTRSAPVVDPGLGWLAVRVSLNLVKSHEERIFSNLGPTRRRISPSIL